MGPLQAIATGLRKAFVFSGRAARTEFWWFALACVLFATVTVQFDLWLTSNQTDQIITEKHPTLDGISLATRVPYEGLSLRGILSLVGIGIAGVPLASAASRRLHDAGMTGRHLIWFAKVAVLVPLSAFVLIKVAMPFLGYAIYSLIFLVVPLVAFTLLAATGLLCWRLSKPSKPLPSEVLP